MDKARSEERERRLAEALRRNLARRKAQARERRAAAVEGERSPEPRPDPGKTGPRERD